MEEKPRILYNKFILDLKAIVISTFLNNEDVVQIEKNMANYCKKVKRSRLRYPGKNEC